MNNALVELLLDAMKRNCPDALHNHLHELEVNENMWIGRYAEAIAHTLRDEVLIIDSLTADNLVEWIDAKWLDEFQTHLHQIASIHS